MKIKISRDEMIAMKNKIQSEAIDAVYDVLVKVGKSVLNMATGSGKTITAAKLIFNKFRKIDTVLFMVPKISLVNQTIEDWKRHGFDFEAATVYMDGNIKSLCDFDEFINRPTDKIKIIFAVYNSVGLDPNGGESIITQSGHVFDLAIYDECHRTVGTEYGTLFTSTVEDNIVRAKYKVFMTATIRMFDVDEDEDDIYNQFSMANEDRYGPIAYSLPIYEAIRLGILAPFDTYLLEVSNDRIKKLLNSEIHFLGEMVKGRHLAAVYSTLKAYEMGSRKIVVMFRQLNDCRDFNNLFNYMQNELGLLNGAIIKSVASNVTPSQLEAPRNIRANDSLGARQWWLKEGPFTRSKAAIAISSPWIKEGEDVPCIDTIIFGDRFNSGIDIIQIIGRALRWYEGKERARIVLPVMEGEANKVARNIQSVVANLETDVQDAQIIHTKVNNTNNNVNTNDNESSESDDTGRSNAERWLDSNIINQTTLSVNQGELNVNILHDETFEPESRLDHDEMLRTLQLKVSNQYLNYIRKQRADYYVDCVLRDVELRERQTKHGVLHSDEHYIHEFAQKYDLSNNEAIDQLSESLKKIQEARKKVELEFFSLK